MKASIVYNRAGFNQEVGKGTDIIVLFPRLFGILLCTGNEQVSEIILHTYGWSEAEFGGFSSFWFPTMIKKEGIELLKRIVQDVKITDHRSVNV